MTAQRLALGTVQFGADYGIANQNGQVTRAGTAAILERARAAGIDTLQTAIGYGESEARLGEIGVREWRVISKLPAVPSGCSDLAGWVEQSVAGSLRRLRLEKLDCLLLHRGADLLDAAGNQLYAALLKLRNERVIGKIGISIYSPAELNQLMPHFQLDHVQTPFNVLDRRIQTSGWLQRLHERGVEVHARSLFLQGLLLMQRRPVGFERWHRVWDAWEQWLRQTGYNPLQACLGFALSFPEINRFVVGVDNVEQLAEILITAGSARERAPAELATEDVELIDPTLWVCA